MAIGARHDKNRHMLGVSVEGSGDGELRSANRVDDVDIDLNIAITEDVVTALIRARGNPEAAEILHRSYVST